MSVYQIKTYLNALKSEKDNLINVSGGKYATERLKKIPIYGLKKILDFRGNLNESEIDSFLELSKRYHYGLIHPCVLERDERKYFDKGLKKENNFTILINLNKDEEELWKSLEKKSIRWGVNTAKKNKLKIEQLKSSEVNKFYEIYKETSEKGGFESRSLDFLKALRDTEISKIFVVKLKKEIIAGGMLLVDMENNYSILDLTASNEKGMKLQAMPFLYWNFILYSKNIGLAYFDLGGYDKEAGKGDKTYNINKFKERFGGEIFEQPVYSTSYFYVIYRKSYRFLKKVKHMFRSRK